MSILNDLQQLISEQEKVEFEERLKNKFDEETDKQISIHHDLLEKLKDA